MKLLVLLPYFLAFHWLSAQDSSDAVTLVQDYLEAGLAGEWNEMESFMMDTIVDYHPTVLAQPVQGAKGVVASWQTSMQAFDSIQYDLLGTGIASISTGELSGNWVFSARKIKALAKEGKKRIEFQMVGFYQVKDNKIVEVRNFGNLLDIYLQAGYELVPPRQ